MRQFFEDTKPGGQLLALGLIFVVLFILSTGVSVIFTLFYGEGASQYVTLTLSQIVCFAGTAFVFASLFYDKPLRHLGLASVEGMPLKIVAAFIILLCLLPLSDWTSRVNDAWHLPQSMASVEEQMRAMTDKAQKILEVFLERRGIGALITNIFVMALVPAICEELLFRGCLQQLMCRLLRNHHVVIWFTAAFFSLFHGEIFAFLPRFFLGAALGYLFYYGGSLWINIAAHFANNAIAIILYYLAYGGVIKMESTDTINAPWYLAIVGLVLACFFMWLFFLRGKKRTNDASLE